MIFPVLKFGFVFQIDKVEDPKALFEKANAFIQSKLGGDGKKGGKDC